MTDASPSPVSRAALADLAERLGRTRSVVDPWAEDTDRGLGPLELAPLLDRWREGFDWRAQEARIAALPWEVVGRGRDAVRVVHQRASAPDASVVLLLHGWPDSVLRFERLLPLLPDVHVVAPALAGFPFAPDHDGPASVDRLADLVAGAMAELGHDRYTPSAGDVGGDVAEVLAARHPDRVVSLHLTNVSARHLFAVDPSSLDAPARAYAADAASWNRRNGGYVAEQSTRPRTLLAGLGDSPAGLTAWLLEKVLGWTDDAERSFSTDELLTWAAAYWFSGTVGTSFASYAEPASIPARTAVPTVVSTFAHDVKPAPRSWIEAFVDLRELIAHDRGGHFAAWEEPEAYAADLRRALALGRP